MTNTELEALLGDLESDRVERKASTSDRGKIKQAICAFANDMPNHRKPGVLFIGVDDDGTCANLAITDDLLLTLAHMRDSGNIQPMPAMQVEKRVLSGCDLAVVIVQPSDAPPVRCDGRIWIRVGPRQATASPQDERRLNERRRNRDLPFDLHPVTSASLGDLNTDLFTNDYLPNAVAADVLERNERSLEEQLTSLRFVAMEPQNHPTVAGLLAIGKSPADFVPGAYVQFLRIDGLELTDPISNRKEIHGPVVSLLRELNDVLSANVSTAVDITSGSRELSSPDYPMIALQQLTANAVMHRDYETTNAPVRVTWFNDRIEIQNPGGPFGQVTCDNFGDPGITDYRNPHLAEVLKTFGFVQRFGVGIPTAQKALKDNGNPQLVFDVRENHVLVTIRSKL